MTVLGELTVNMDTRERSELWGQFANSSDIRWVRADITSIGNSRVDNQVNREFSWRIRLAREWLDQAPTDLKIRFVIPSAKTFSDSLVITLDLTSIQSRQSSSRLLAQTQD